MAEYLVKHRLLWSLRILGTEKWLGEMASSGYILENLDFRGRFEFKQDSKKFKRFCFTYNKFAPAGNYRNNADGWDNDFRKNNWNLYTTEEAEPKTIPNRRGLFLRNNSLLCLYAFISSILLLLIMALSLSGFLVDLDRSSYESFFRNSVAIIALFAVVLIANFIFYLSLSSANSHLLEREYDKVLPVKAYRQFISYKTFETWLEKLLIKDGDIVKRFYPIWLSTPHGVEKRLERMESRGYNAYKIHKSGLLVYFTKGKPRKISYYVISGDSSLITRCIEDGWQVVYSGEATFVKASDIAVISRQYEDKPLNPFEDPKETVSNAERLFEKYVIFYSSILIIFVAMLSILAFLQVSISVINVVICAIIVCLLFIIKAIVSFVYNAARVHKSSK